LAIHIRGHYVFAKNLIFLPPIAIHGEGLVFRCKFIELFIRYFYHRSCSVLFQIHTSFALGHPINHDEITLVSRQ